MGRFEIKGITLGYKGKEQLLAERLSVSAAGGELVALLGRNGVGKSTLLRAMAGVRAPMAGEVLLDGKSIYEMTPGERARKVAFVMTEHVSVAHLRVWDVVGMGRAPYTGWFGTLGREDEQIVEDVLERVGMSGFREKMMDNLSDGERQRVMIARALAQDSPVMFLDEPTAFLDLANRYQIVLLLKKLAHEMGKIIVFSSHDLAISMQLCDVLWVMANPAEGGLQAGTPVGLRRSGALDVIFKGTPLRLLNDEGVVVLENKE